MSEARGTHPLRGRGWVLLSLFGVRHRPPIAPRNTRCGVTGCLCGPRARTPASRTTSPLAAMDQDDVAVAWPDFAARAHRHEAHPSRASTPASALDRTTRTAIVEAMIRDTQPHRARATTPARACAVAVLALAAAACASDTTPTTDAGGRAADAQASDAAAMTPDAGEAARDAEPRDAELSDAATPSGCDALCARANTCSPAVPLAACTTSCETAAEPLRVCLLACDAAASCDDFLACTTRCGAPGNPNAPEYGRCADGCRPGTTICVASSSTTTVMTFAVCAPPCDGDGMCPTAASGTATPQCATEAVPPVCRLSCRDGERCPDDMVCFQGNCTWPVP